MGDLAARLYSSSFREALGNSTVAVIGKTSAAQVTSLSLEPKRFELPSTTTITTTGTVTATATSTAAATSTVAVTKVVASTAARHRDIASTSSSSDSSKSDASALAAKLSLLLLPFAIVIV